MDKQRRYFVAKCDNADRLETASNTCIWACRDRLTNPQPRDVLTDAMSKCDVILIFSVNGCHGWHGYARMISPPDDSISVSDIGSSSDSWHHFSIHWQCLYLRQFRPDQCLPFRLTEKLLCDDGHTPVTLARNLQELEVTSGATLCQLIDDHHRQLCTMRHIKTEKETNAMKSRSFFRPLALGPSSNQHEMWNEFISQVEALGRVLLACAFGSQRYNCHIDTSDVDMFVVYAADTKDVLGLKPVRTTIKGCGTSGNSIDSLYNAVSKYALIGFRKSNSTSSEVEDFDYTVLEVSRFCELLFAGDPKCVETLFMNPSTAHYISDDFSQLVTHRQKFLTRQFAEKYLADATGQKGLKRLDKLFESGEALKIPMSSKVSKLVYVIIRLLLGARDVFCGRQLRVYLEDDEPDRLLLIDVRHCNRSYQQVRLVIDSLLKEIEEAQTQSSSALDEVPSTNREKVVEDWLLTMRFENLSEYIRRMKHCESVSSNT